MPSVAALDLLARARSAARNAAAVLSLLAAACAPGDISAGAGPRTYASREAADAALAAFGRNTPACRMWTNWQSLCSRTGPGMATHCKADPGLAVQPSEPFCVNREVPPGTTNQAQFDTPDERRSRNRFCELLVGAPGSMREQVGSMPECELYAARRPFDGRRPEAIAHPLCRQWRQVTPETAAVSGPAACEVWADPLPCPQVVGNAERYPTGTSLVMTFVRDSRSQAVWGVFCI